MPSHIGHSGLSKIVTGKEFEWVNAEIDRAYPYLGWNHRVSMHDPLQIYAHFSKNDGSIDPSVFAAAYLHLIADDAGSADPVLRALIDAMGVLVLKGNDPNAFNRVFIAMMLAINR